MAKSTSITMQLLLLQGQLPFKFFFFLLSFMIYDAMKFAYSVFQLCKQVDSWLKRSSTIRVTCTTSPSSAVVVGGRGCRCGDYYCHQRQDHFTRSSQHGSSFWLRGSLLCVLRSSKVALVRTAMRTETLVERATHGSKNDTTLFCV